MEREGGAHKSPALIEADVEDGIEELLTLVVRPHGAEPERGGHVALADWTASAGEVDGGPAATAGSPARILKREARRQAAAELPRIGKARNADGRRVAAEPLR